MKYITTENKASSRTLPRCAQHGLNARLFGQGVRGRSTDSSSTVTLVPPKPMFTKVFSQAENMAFQRPTQCVT